MSTAGPPQARVAPGSTLVLYLSDADCDWDLANPTLEKKEVPEVHLSVLHLCSDSWFSSNWLWERISQTTWLNREEGMKFIGCNRISHRSAMFNLFSCEFQGVGKRGSENPESTAVPYWPWPGSAGTPTNGPRSPFSTQPLPMPHFSSAGIQPCWSGAWLDFSSVWQSWDLACRWVSWLSHTLPRNLGSHLDLATRLGPYSLSWVKEARPQPAGTVLPTTSPMSWGSSWPCCALEDRTGSIHECLQTRLCLQRGDKNSVITQWPEGISKGGLSVLLLPNEKCSTNTELKAKPAVSLDVSGSITSQKISPYLLKMML